MIEGIESALRANRALAQQTTAGTGAMRLLSPEGACRWCHPGGDSALPVVAEHRFDEAAGAPVARLQLLWPPGCEQPRAAFAALAALIGEVATLESELDAMAGELAERYEELQLLYKREETLGERGDDQTTDRLLRDCVTRLSLSLAVAQHSGFGLFAAHGQRPLPERELIALLNDAAGEQARGTRALILNAERSPLPGHHALFAPLRPSPNSPPGGLWFFRPQAQEKFFNSDSRIAVNICAEIVAHLRSHHDTTTGLLNRAGFESASRPLLDSRSTPPATLAYINLQRFRIVNDNAGYAAGDQLLRHFAAALRERLRESDVVARLVGDEFVVLLKNCSADQARDRFELLINSYRDAPFRCQGQRFPTPLAIGLREIDAASTDLEHCLKDAEAACTLAKQSGNDQIRLYDRRDRDYQRFSNERMMVPLLNTALAENRFELFAQPIVSLNPAYAARRHAEILVRLRDDDGQMVSPGDFVPAAERFGMMPDIDRWIIRHAIERFGSWSGARPHIQASLSINLSGRSLSADNASEILDLLALSPLRPEQLCFEITETAALVDMATAINFIERIRAVGCSFALDDFGAGLSSFSYLQNLPVDYLKIDGAFVKGIAEDRVSRTFVDGINKIGQAMGLRTVAEFVADRAVLDELNALGVDFAQGYHTGAPVPLAEWLAGLDAAPPRPRAVGE